MIKKIIYYPGGYVMIEKSATVGISELHLCRWAMPDEVLALMRKQALREADKERRNA